MIAVPDSTYLTPAAYLELEATSSIKHEYIDGDVYAMAGASDDHVTLALNLASELRVQLRGTGCRVYISDMKVQVKTANRFFYPDVMVTCDSADQATSTYKQFPKLIVEVLSDSTAAYDRGDKFADYRTLDSLEEYVLINTHLQRVECYRRQANGSWSVHFFSPPDSTFELTSVDFQGTFDALYENVTFAKTERGAG